jgi:hypothetical protein
MWLSGYSRGAAMPSMNRCGGKLAACGLAGGMEFADFVRSVALLDSSLGRNQARQSGRDQGRLKNVQGFLTKLGHACARFAWLKGRSETGADGI